jgi:hypothetical protein
MGKGVGSWACTAQGEHIIDAELKARLLAAVTATVTEQYGAMADDLVRSPVPNRATRVPHTTQRVALTQVDTKDRYPYLVVTLTWPWGV